MDISIIILSYNGKDLLRQTLDSVKSAINFDANIETILADNGSTDGVLQLVKENYPWVKIVENGQNLGFSAGNNKGVAKSRGKYGLFLNSDTKLNPDTIEYVYKRMESDQSIGAATCRVELQGGEIDPASHRGFPTPWRAFCYFSKLERFSSKIDGATFYGKFVRKLFGGYHLVDFDLFSEHQIDSGTGAFLLVRSEVGEAVGWWDEDYFFYGEDIDFCFKIKSLSKKIMYFPEVKMIHYKHQSGLKKGQNEIQSTAEEIEKNRAIRKRSTEAFYDAMIIFYNKHYKNVYPGIVRYLVFNFINIKKRLALRKI